MNYYEVIIHNGGGIITLPNHLGVFVGPDSDNTPPGWLYVPIDGLTPERLEEYVDQVRVGRISWPTDAQIRVTKKGKKQ